MFTNKKREGINRFVCNVSHYVAKILKASIKYHKPPITHNAFRHCRVRFRWTTFLETAVVVGRTKSSRSLGSSHSLNSTFSESK